LHLTGASTQISFYAPEATNERYTMDLFSTKYDVYSYSYLCYGQEQTRIVYQGQRIQAFNGSTIVDDPCLQRDYTSNVTYKDINSSACSVGQFVSPHNFTSATKVMFR
jgi:hypothetical protein